MGFELGEGKNELKKHVDMDLLFIITVRSAASWLEKSRILITIPWSLDIVSGRPSRQRQKPSIEVYLIQDVKA